MPAVRQATGWVRKSAEKYPSRIFAEPGALIRLLARDKFGVDEESMLKVVDAEVGRLAKIHRAKMSRNFCSALVRRLNRRAQFGTSDEHIGLEVVDALIEPEIHRLHGVVGSGELVHLDRPRSCAFEIRARDVHLRPWHLTGIDGFLQFEIGVRLKRSCGANRGYAAGKIKPRKTVSHLAENAAAHGIKHVVVHPHQSRNHAVAMQVEHLRILGHARGGGIADGIDLPLAENESLIFARGSPSAIDDANVRESNDRRVDFDECLDLRRKILRPTNAAQGNQQPYEHDNLPHRVSSDSLSAGLYVRVWLCAVSAAGLSRANDDPPAC